MSNGYGHPLRWAALAGVTKSRDDGRVVQQVIPDNPMLNGGVLDRKSPLAGKRPLVHLVTASPLAKPRGTRCQPPPCVRRRDGDSYSGDVSPGRDDNDLHSR